jgi:hypothetical protein
MTKHASDLELEIKIDYERYGSVEDYLGYLAVDGHFGDDITAACLVKMLDDKIAINVVQPGKSPVLIGEKGDGVVVHNFGYIPVHNNVAPHYKALGLVSQHV